MNTIPPPRPPRFAATLRIFLVACVFWMAVQRASGEGVSGSSEPLLLVQNRKTSYVIVRPDHPTAVDQYAVEQLARYLHQMTGATFEAADPSDVPPEKPAIYIGISEPVRARLGEDPATKLKRQEHVVKTAGRDLFLYGEGVHGNFYAVMDFLENSLGWRWYSVFANPVLPDRPDITLQPIERKRQFSFLYREVSLNWDRNFFYQQRINAGYEHRLKLHDKKDKGPFVSEMPVEIPVHSLHSYIPPSPDSTKVTKLGWMERSNYFETNPEFFSMDEKGNYVPDMQLDFSNKALREELTKNILRHIEMRGENYLIVIDAVDRPGRFSYSPGSIALEEKYQSRSGPLIDYLIELCHLLQKKHPGVKVKTLAYRRSQTQIPPVLPGGGKLPDNLIVSFAPIEDSAFADWTHPDAKNQDTYKDLVAWSKITHEGNLWAWIYPNPFGSGAVLPIGNIDRLITNVRMAHQAGVRGLFADHNGFIERGGFSELQSYLLYKLMQDVNIDTDAVIEEFTDHFYGKAGPSIRRYLDELEKERREMKELPRGVTYTTGQRFDRRTFPYLTSENIHRWQTEFDTMQKLAADQPGALDNVRLARRELDYATLCWWFDLRKNYPDYFVDHAIIKERIEAANAIKPENTKTAPGPLGPALLKEFLTIIESGGEEKPLPPEFNEIPEDRIRTFVPVNHDAPRRGEEGKRIDPEAARGYAAIVDRPGAPLKGGFYQVISKSPPKGVHGPRFQLEAADVKPGEYQLHKIGRVEITPDCLIWVGRSWQTHINLGEQLYEPGADNLWDAYISIKCDGPGYGGAAGKDQALVDRIIMVRASGSQF